MTWREEIEARPRELHRAKVGYPNDIQANKRRMAFRVAIRDLRVDGDHLSYGAQGALTTMAGEFADYESKFWRFRSTLAKDLGASEPTIKKWLREAYRFDVLHCVQGGREQAATYYFNPRYLPPIPEDERVKTGGARGESKDDVSSRLRVEGPV